MKNKHARERAAAKRGAARSPRDAAGDAPPRERRFPRFLRRNAFRLVYLGVLLALAAAIAFLFTYVDRGALEVSIYQLISSKVTGNIRVAQLSDLHGREFGEDNSALLERVAELKPDIIVMTGDMVTMSEEADIAALEALCRELAAIAPSYFACGNHEFGLIYHGHAENLLDSVAATGVTVLNRSSAELTVDGTEILIGGFYRSESGFADDASLQNYLSEFCESDALKIMLVHEPNLFANQLSGYDFDVVFSGHAHGGQIRFPVIGPLYAPDQGIFPKLTTGLSTHDGVALVVSRGLGNDTRIPRVNNNPELVVLDVNWY